MKQFLISTFFALLLALNAGCGACLCGCPSGAPDTYDKHCLATITLKDSNNYWLDSLQQNLAFLSNLGVENHIEISKLQKYYTEVTLSEKPLIDKDGCEVENGHYVEYLSRPFQRYLLNDQSGNGLTIARSVSDEDVNKIKQSLNDSAKAADVLYVIFNYSRFDIIPKSTKPNIKYVWYDTLTLGSNKFQDITFVYTDTTGSPTQTVRPYGIYYSMRKGIIGYVSTGGSFWVSKQ